MLRSIVGLCLLFSMTSASLAQIDEDERPDRPKPQPVQQPLALPVFANLVQVTQQHVAIVLMRNSNVQADLKLSDVQKSQVEENIKTLRAKQRELRQTLVGVQGRARQQKQKEFIEKSRKISADADQALRKLLNKDQSARLKQLALQRQGLSALRSKEVMDALKITKQQQAQFDQVRDDNTAKRKQLAQDYRIKVVPARSYGVKSKELRKALEVNTLNVLTEEQQKKFREMKGKELELRPMRKAVVPAPIRLQIRPARLAPRKVDGDE